MSSCPSRLRAYVSASVNMRSYSVLGTVQDFFFVELGIKPCVHILEIRIFSKNQVIVRPTKIMNNLLKEWKNFQH